MALVGRLAGAYPIDMDRIDLTGLSRGGRGADVMLDWPFAQERRRALPAEQQRERDELALRGR